MLKGSFDGVTLDSIQGYRIAASFTPGGGNGFNGNIYVTLLDRTAAATEFKTGIDLGAAGNERRGTLDFKDGVRTYSFTNIDLYSIEAGVTRNQRYRILEFKYDPTFGSEEELQVTMSNSSPEKVQDNKLKRAYDAALPNQTEHLLGFRSRLAAGEVSIYRFVSLRAGDNSMLAKLIEVNEQIRTQQPLPEFKIGFSKGDIALNQATISKIYVHESYGTFHENPLPSLSAIRAVQLNPNTMANVLRVGSVDYSSQDLLVHHDTTEIDLARDATTQAVTVVLQPGVQQSLIVT